MNTDATIARVLELDGLATPEPWRSKLNHAHFKCVWFDPEDNYTTLELKPDDADLIAYYRTAAPELARELVAAREALEGTLALAIAWAAHYELDQKLEGFHPTHSRIITKAQAALSTIDSLKP